MKVKFTCASVGEKSQTLRTSQFEGLFNFKNGQQYRIYFTNGKYADGYITRNGTTLYIPAEEFPSGLKRAEVGNPVFRTIRNIKKL